MKWFGKKGESAKSVEVTTSSIDAKFERAIGVIESMLKKDIRVFFNQRLNLETLVSKFRNGDIVPALGMMAMTSANADILAKAKDASDEIQKIYK